jgi:hypothetical protein
VINIPVVTVVFLVGVALLFVGILGGGFVVKEVAIPKLHIVPRLCTVAAGAILVVLGIALVSDASLNPPSNGAAPTTQLSAQGEQSQPGGSAPAPKPVTSQTVPFEIHDQLGDQQVEEQVTVLVDGKNVGTLSVSPDFQDQVLKLSASEGSHSYMVSARARFIDGHVYTGVGQGTIDVRSGKTYEVAGEVSGSTWLVTLMEV